MPSCNSHDHIPWILDIFHFFRRLFYLVFILFFVFCSLLTLYGEILLPSKGAKVKAEECKVRTIDAQLASLAALLFTSGPGTTTGSLSLLLLLLSAAPLSSINHTLTDTRWLTSNWCLRAVNSCPCTGQSSSTVAAAAHLANWWRLSRFVRIKSNWQSMVIYKHTHTNRALCSPANWLQSTPIVSVCLCVWVCVCSVHCLRVLCCDMRENDELSL